MQVPILIEPVGEGAFRATAGAPFGLSAQGATADEAASRLEAALRARLSAGARLTSIELGANAAAPLVLPPLSEGEKWAMEAMNEAIAEHRRLEAEADQ